MARVSLLDRARGRQSVSRPLCVDSTNGAGCGSRASWREAARGEARFRVFPGRFTSRLVRVATSPQECSRFGLQRTDSCRTWSAILLEHCWNSARVGENRNGSMSYWPSGTADLDRLWPRLTGSRLREWVSPVTY